MTSPELEILRPHLADPDALQHACANFTTGIVGATSGILIADWEVAKSRKARGEKVILLLQGDYKPEWMYQIAGMDGVVVAGDKVSGHLAIMLQNAGIPAVIGKRSGELPKEGEPATIALDTAGRGAMEGKVIAGNWEIIPPDEGHFSAFPASRVPPKVFANASSVDEIQKAIALGVEGIGLVRTEHFIRSESDLRMIQRLITEIPPPVDALAAFGKTQREETGKLLSAAANKADFPILLRLIDPPYEELLDAEGREAFETYHSRENWRGVQLANQILGLYETQIQAIADAMRITKYQGEMHLVVPHVEHADEMEAVRRMVGDAFGGHVPTNIKMVAALESKKGAENSRVIAPHAAGILVAMNDLTAEIIGCGRDDAEGVRQWMESNKSPNPFKSVVAPVREVVTQIATGARAGNPDITFNTPSGQVAGDKDSIKFCAGLGFDSISVPATHALIAQTRSLAAVAQGEHMPLTIRSATSSVPLK